MSSFNNYIKDEKINIEPIVEETLDRIDIGGRNLLRYTDQNAYFNKFTSYSGSISLIDGWIKVTQRSDAATAGVVTDKTSDVSLLEKGKTYILSFDAYLDNSATVDTLELSYHYVMSNGGNFALEKRVFISKTKARYNVVFTYNGTTTQSFGAMVGARITNCPVFYVKNIKLEEGNIATDWTPAPEDLMPNIAGSTGNLIYNDGTKWTTVITPSTDVCNILTIGGGTGSPTWFTGPSAGSNISLLTGGGGTGSMRWMYGPSSESLMTIGGSSVNYIQTPSSSSSAQVLVGGGGTGVRWASVENMRGQKGDTGATGATGPRGNTGVAGSQYIKTTEAVGSFMTPGNTLASKYGFRIGDFTITSDRMLLSCVSVTGSSFATITSLSGTTGATGLRGATGATGPRGTGAQGVTGLRGVTGAQGPGGLGPQGARGYTGPRGVQGLRGYTGLRGVTGLRGATGVGIRMMAECDCTNPGDGYIDDLGDYYVLDEYNEFNLISNLKGPAGTNGSQGARGYTGPRGYTGLRGVTGLRGATGPGGTANSVALGTTNRITATMTNRSSSSYPIILASGSANAHLYYNSTHATSIKVYDGQRMLTLSYDVSADSYDTNSDINLKNIVENDLSIEQCYNLINLCSTIIYTLKNGNPDKRYIGMIAQEIELYFPDIVKTNSDGFKSVNYNSIIPICVRVIRDINNRLKNIEDRLYALENKEKGTN